MQSLSLMVDRTDCSSVISESRRQMITFRDGDACVLCGCYPIDVAHIVARKAGDLGQASHPVPYLQWEWGLNLTF
jgi:hypothetical protein